MKVEVKEEIEPIERVKPKNNIIAPSSSQMDLKTYAGRNYLEFDAVSDGFCGGHAMLGRLNARGVYETDTTKDQVADRIQEAKNQGRNFVHHEFIDAFFRGFADERRQEYDNKLCQLLDSLITAFRNNQLDICEFVEQAFPIYSRRFRERSYFPTQLELQLIAYLYDVQGL